MPRAKPKPKPQTMAEAEQEKRVVTGIAKRLGPWQIILGCAGAALGIFLGYRNLDWPRPVWNYELQEVKGEVKGEIGKSRDDSKSQFNRLSLQILETKQQGLFQSRTSLNTQIATVEAALRKTPNDPLLIERLRSLKGFSDMVDRRMAATEIEIENAKAGR